MKKLYSLIAASFLIAANANATTYELSSGNFSSQVNGVTFVDGDTIEIMSGESVSYNSTMTISADIVFDIRGSFSMNGNNKSLVLSPGSIVNLWPNASITGTSATQKLFIGTNNVFDGAQTINSSYFVLTATGSNGFWLGAPLPLKFLSFDATVTSNFKVSFNWTAVNDGPATMFTIETSLDGKTWDEVAQVKATGSEHETVSYSSELEAPKNVKSAMYRIRYDGSNGASVVYSNVRTVNINSNNNTPVASVFVTGSVIKVNLSQVAGGSSARVVVNGLDGKVIYNQEYSDSAPIAIPASVPGMYVVTVTDNATFRIAQKVVVQ